MWNFMMRVAATSILLLASLNTSHGVVTLSDNPHSQQTSRLNIHIPHSLFKEDGYEHRQALFGIPAYGGSIAQNVYYIQSDLCDQNKVDPTTGVPAREINPDTGRMKPWPAPYILMVDRGECSFVKKVRNAQSSGAAGVIIADNLCLCSDSDCIINSKSSQCETQLPILADDGSGADISIPSFLMFKTDADNLKVQLKANRPALVEMTWSLPNLDGRVEYELWTTPLDGHTKSFLNNFKSIAVALGDRAYFTPRMYIFDGVRAGCYQLGSSACYGLCTNNGRYCFALSPDNDLQRGISGADVVKESLRRLCIWKQYGAADGIGEQWWNYVSLFNERCGKTELFSDEACIKGVYQGTGVDGDAVERCMVDSGGTERDQVNSILDQELLAQEGVVVIPTAYVNSVPIRDEINSANVFRALCAAYPRNDKPVICDLCASSFDQVVVECVKSGGEPHPAEKNHGTDARNPVLLRLVPLLVTVLVVLCIVLATYFFIKIRPNDLWRRIDVSSTSRNVPSEQQDRENDGGSTEFLLLREENNSNDDTTS